MWIDCPSGTQSGSETKDPGLRLSLLGQSSFSTPRAESPSGVGRDSRIPARLSAGGPPQCCRPCPHPHLRRKAILNGPGWILLLTKDGAGSVSSIRMVNRIGLPLPRRPARPQPPTAHWRPQ